MNVTASQTPRASIAGHPRRIALVVIGTSLTALLILLPLVAVFYYALREGWTVYVGHLKNQETVHAIWLTLLAALVAVPVNTVFGIMAAWTIAKFDFPGRRLLTSLIELPLSISPIVIGIAYLFVFGMQGLLGEWLSDHELIFFGYEFRFVFSVPAIVIVTTIVTMPFVFREVLPLMQTQGTSEELAAISLGASGWKTFLKVTLPNIKWALIYGISLTFARSLGEFGSVAVVSGAVRGETNTMTLQIHMLFDDASQTGAFAVASILTSIALVTMLVKTWVERREARRLAEGTGLNSE
ncbi:sulfate ABC transporter permease [Rariglobus hedericola]|uniref:Sulfate ABC transporter permease n=1 Tax=Rariglobus hedericola TaxID=2597822 RepID=A0A556QDG2_9BACT|nr:sulfate ABC transporter permease subunit [Rariglobus hedericola]TSJ74702.1 sulfate ABC transporter permease [Rariglobus hedericola]